VGPEAGKKLLRHLVTFKQRFYNMHYCKTVKLLESDNIMSENALVLRKYMLNCVQVKYCVYQLLTNGSVRIVYIEKFIYIHIYIQYVFV
jgi:hypothetical protein